MAFPRKKRRPIVVGDRRYFWVASSDSGWINLHVRADVRAGQVLTCKFREQVIVTPGVVRHVIEHGLTHGWTPMVPGTELELGHLDHRLRFWMDEDRPR